MKKYAAKLLYQFRVVVNNKSNKMRICEEKIIRFDAENADEVYKKVNQRGKDDEYSYLNDDKNRVYYEFIGIQDLMHLGIECEYDEVWYEIKNYLKPNERKNKFIPNKNELSIFNE